MLRRASIIQGKPFLKQFYQDGYSSISELLPGKINGPVVELGSGGWFLKAYCPPPVTHCVGGLRNGCNPSTVCYPFLQPSFSGETNP